VALAPDNSEGEVEAPAAGRVKPGASVALRVAPVNEAEAASVANASEAVTVTVTVATLPEAHAVDVELNPASEPVLVELGSASESVPFKAPREPFVELKPLLSVQFASESESTVAREDALVPDPEPVSPPERPALLMRDSASACVSQVMDCRILKNHQLRQCGTEGAGGLTVPTLFRRGNAKHWVPPVHSVVSHLPLTHCPKEPSTQAMSVPIRNLAVNRVFSVNIRRRSHHCKSRSS
jgi:hypothetical protein